GRDDHVGELPVELFGQFVAERLFSFDTIWLFEGGHVEPAFRRFAPGNLSAAIGDPAVNERDLRSELAALNDVCARSVARHEDVRFETSPSCICGERSTSVARAGNGELGRTKIFRHGYANRHPPRLETLCWIL